MHLWQFLSVVGIIFLILEIFTPSMFFLNFALAAFICAPLSLVVNNYFILVLLFFILSFVSFAFLRPVIMKKINKDTETGVNSKYIDKTVKTDVEITGNNGVINIYGERWEARSENGENIPAGSEVRIVRNESIVMYVEKID